MNVLVVGDVHGCYHTFKALVDQHWNPEKEFLVQVGDFISKGAHSAACVTYARELQKKYPYQVFFLKGNHEYRYTKFHDKPGRDKLSQVVKNDFLKHDLNLKKVHEWLKKLPLKWETESMLITHAGVSKTAILPFSATSPRGVLHNRSAVKNLGKVQVFGHKMQTTGEIKFKEKSNAWCIDTGAWMGNKLSALKFKYNGKLKETIQIKTLPEDLV